MASVEQNDVHAHGAHDEHASMSKGVIFRIFLILLGLTAVEFIVALAIPLEVMSKPVKDTIYIVLTIAKAFYIVAYCMHLKFERVSLIYSILVPLIFIVGLLAALLHEGGHWLNLG